MALLSCRGVEVSYGGVRALEPTDLTVEPGQLVGLIGPNGAGKSTLIDAVTGFTASRGSVTFDGRELSGVRPHRRAAAGIGRTFQTLELFEDLTVHENLLVTASTARWWSPLLDLVHPSHDRALDAADEALALTGLEHCRDALPPELPNGTRKLVAVARALAGRPRLLLLDEPAAGLDTDESRRLGENLRRLVDGGLAMLLVDHDMGLVLSVCDVVHVLDFGTVIASGPPDVIRSDERVIHAYLGSGATA